MYCGPDCRKSRSRSARMPIFAGIRDDLLARSIVGEVRVANQISTLTARSCTRIVDTAYHREGLTRVQVHDAIQAPASEQKPADSALGDHGRSHRPEKLNTCAR